MKRRDFLKVGLAAGVASFGASDGVKAAITKKCGNCNAWVEIKTTSAEGECRRDPQEVITKRRYWCRSFEE